MRTEESKSGSGSGSVFHAVLRFIDFDFDGDFDGDFDFDAHMARSIRAKFILVPTLPRGNVNRDERMKLSRNTGRSRHHGVCH